MAILIVLHLQCTDGPGRTKHRNTRISPRAEVVPRLSTPPRSGRDAGGDILPLLVFADGEGIQGGGRRGRRRGLRERLGLR